MRKCAKEIRLNQKTLNNRWNQKAFKIIRENINKRLIIAQERAIRNYIIRINEKNMLLTLKLIENIINFVFREVDSDAAFLEKRWIKKFEKLNSDENLSDSNIMKYFYLNMTRSINVSEVNYINSFKLEAKLKWHF